MTDGKSEHETAKQISLLPLAPGKAKGEWVNKLTNELTHQNCDVILYLYILTSVRPSP